MYKNVLVVFSKQDTALREQIEEEALHELVDAEGRIVSVHAARSHADAFSRMDWIEQSDDAQELHFAVIGHRLALDARSPVEETGGIELCEKLRELGRTFPILLLVPHITLLTNDLLTRCGEARVTPLHTGADVLALVRKQVSDYRPPARVLDILLTLQADSTWEYSLRGTHFRFAHAGPLRPSSDLLTLARALTSTVALAPRDSETWYGFFKQLGTALSVGLCETTKFGAELERGLKLAGGIEHARISFSLGNADRAHFPIALEALFPPPQYAEVPWMVRAPLYRTLGTGPALSRPLFGRGVAPLNILLVGADAHGYVNQLTDDRGNVVHLRPLNKVDRECVGLQRQFEWQKGRHLVRQVEYVKPEQEGCVTRRRLFETLEAPQGWSIVHFAGHSMAKEDGAKESRGYLFIGGPERPEAIDIDQISTLLRRTTLVYLSSCESLSPAFAIELARHVPAVIGFRWPVDDWFAALHAHLFYRFLFRERNVETAFFKTRQAIHRRYTTRERVWASSMLVFGRADTG